MNLYKQRVIESSTRKSALMLHVEVLFLCEGLIAWWTQTSEAMEDMKQQGVYFHLEEGRGWGIKGTVLASLGNDRTAKEEPKA